MGKLYRKVGRRYKEVGEDFTGFPADGIWFVKDGRQNCMVKLAEIEDTPKYYPLLAPYAEEVAEELVKEFRGNAQLSFFDIAQVTLKVFARKMEEK